MTYAGLAVPFLTVAVTALVVGAAVQRPDATWWRATGLTLVALLVLTIVFDNLMIAVDLFRYDSEQTSGLTVGLAPVEDLAWPVAAALGLPGLWLLLQGGER
jgi:lycopene cyclase domain-containing protein